MFGDVGGDRRVFTSRWICGRWCEERGGKHQRCCFEWLGIAIGMDKTDSEGDKRSGCDGVLGSSTALCGRTIANLEKPCRGSMCKGGGSRRGQK